MTSSKPLIDSFVTVVLPCGNVAHTLKEYIESLHQKLQTTYTFFEIILVLDAPTDNTRRVAESLLKSHEGLRMLLLSRHHGLDIAASAGIDSSIGDVVIVLSPESDPSTIIPELVSKALDTQSLIYGIPESSESQLAPRTLFSKLFNWYCKRYLNIDIQRRASLVRAMNRKMANTFTQNKDKHRSLRLMTAQLGLNAIALTYTPSNMSLQKKSFWKDVDNAIDIIVATSSHPMRLLSRIALSVAGLSFLYSFYVLAIFLFKQDVAPGWVTLSFQLSILFFLLFIVLAILSEYLGKMMNDSRRTEAYSVLDEYNSSVLVDAESKINVYQELKN